VTGDADGPASPEAAVTADADASGIVTQPAPTAAPVQALPPEALETQQLVFEGDGAEYFRIWIVNLALSVITLGIYSPWAKVRRLQYFYRNTRIAGAGFDYHGRPIALLKGRIVAALMLGAYYAATAISPVTGLFALAGLALLLPWLIVRSLRFRLYNSSYRGIRFRFHGTTREAYWVYLVLPVLSIFTLFLLMPFVLHQMRKYQQDNTSYGSAQLATTVPVGEFYITYVLGGFVFAGLLTVAMITLMVIVGVMVAIYGDEHADAPQLLAMVPFFILYATAILFSRAVIQSRLQNAVWSSSRLGPHGFNCTLRALRLFGITVTNVAASILTLGLFLPFAQVRLTRYMASEFRMYPGGPLDAIARAAADDPSAVGDEAAEMFDIDIAF
jgi:uncharacterized membrane protein YjgN (DUF898 family)